MVVSRGNWYIEPITPTFSFASPIVKILFSGKTKFQSMQIIETGAFGRTLLLDGKTQSAAKDEFIYHESLVQPAMVAHAEPKSVFIGGGGEGATAREVLRHASVKKLVMVDLDGQTVDFCKEHLKEWHQGAYEDPRTKLVIADAKKYLENTKEKFDVIILDLVDPMEGGPAYQLYTQEYYRTVKSKLNPGGMMVTQAGPVSVLNCAEVHAPIHNTLKTVFPTVVSYTAHMQSFSEPWGFCIASTGPNPKELTTAEVNARIAKRGLKKLRNYDGETHQHLFSLQKYMRDAIAKEKRVMTKDNPIFVF